MEFRERRSVGFVFVYHVPDRDPMVAVWCKKSNHFSFCCSLPQEAVAVDVGPTRYTASCNRKFK